MPRAVKKHRGVYEKERGSGVWWIRYHDANSKLRREKVGNKATAIELYRKRKTQVLVGEKLPEKFRQRKVKFGELADDALAYCEANNRGSQFDAYRIGRLRSEFQNCPAEVPIDDIRKWFSEQEWKPGTHNRYRTTLSLIYRLAIENKKAITNPARLLKRNHEDNGRVRFLGQFKPSDTALDYLRGFTDEGSRLKAVIRSKYASHMPEFEIALHTGMRPSEQFNLTWDRVDLERKLVTIPRSKNGRTRHIPLNSVAIAAFQELFGRSQGAGKVFVNIHGEPLKGYKHWFDDAVSEAGVSNFTWYCLRHTFASRCAMAGVDIRTIAELMGHQSIQMTMRYAHLGPSHKLAAVERIVSGMHLQEPTDTNTDTEQTKGADTRVQWSH